MTALVSQSVGSVLDNYADVIEGGNAYRGAGDSYLGVPGLNPSDAKLARDGFDSIIVSSNGTPTTIPYASGDWRSDEWVKERIPGFWAIDANDEHRKITGWDNTLKKFTVNAFTTAPAQDDVILIQQGFKRMAEGESILEMAGGWDRQFELETEGQGVDIGFSGAGVRSYEVPMVLRVRFLKYAHERLTHKRVLSNLKILGEALTMGIHRSGLVRALMNTAPGIVAEDDKEKVIVEQTFDLIYRISTTFK